MNLNTNEKNTENKGFSNHEPDIRCRACCSLIPLSSEICPGCGSKVFGFKSNTYDEVKCESDFCDYMETTRFNNNRYTYPMIITALIIVIILGFKFNDLNAGYDSRPLKAHSDGNAFSIGKRANGDFAN